MISGNRKAIRSLRLPRSLQRNRRKRREQGSKQLFTRWLSGQASDPGVAPAGGGPSLVRFSRQGWGFSVGACWVSFAPSELEHLPTLTHDLRRGLHSFAASRLHSFALAASFDAASFALRGAGVSSATIARLGPHGADIINSGR